ncbi:MAG: LOG family protein [Alphaproteobacteria bacterium]|nr:LOG family protein [Alphaproteobacteria bacterium]
MVIKHTDKRNIEQIVSEFKKSNKEDGLRVFVAGGARGGKGEVYTEESYHLGRLIVKMGMKLDFGLSSSGIMGAVARGVIDGWREKQKKYEDLVLPINAITTKEYYSLYESSDELVNKIENIVVADTLEDRKNKLLNADFVVFAPGGVGTLDELAYDCVAMQDGFIGLKPFILYNIDGFFHHLVEYLKHISIEGFANPIPFIVVDDNFELGIVLRLLKLRYKKPENSNEAYANARQLIYELPYFLKKKNNSLVHVEEINDYIDDIEQNGTDEQQEELAREIEEAYLEKEIERMYERLAKTGKDTSIVSDKLTRLKKRKDKK